MLQRNKEYNVKDADDIYLEKRIIQATTLKFSTCENFRCKNHVQKTILERERCAQPPVSESESKSFNFNTIYMHSTVILITNLNISIWKKSINAKRS